MFPAPIGVNTPPNSPRKSPPRIKRKRIIPRYNNTTNLNNTLNNEINSVCKRIKFENIPLEPYKNPIYFPKDKTCHIDKIPLELLIIIINCVSDFQELLTMSMVCKKWRHAITRFSTPSFIADKYPEKVRKSIRNFQLIAITKLFPRIEQISLVNSPSVHHQAFQSIIDNCRNLKVLKLDTVGYCPETFLDNIIFNSSSLKELKLKKNIELWSASDLPYFELKKLEITDNDKFFDKSLEILAQKCHQLESLLISSCSNFNLESAGTIYESSFDIENMTQFLKNNKNLKSLTFKKMNITNRVLDGIATCSKLEVLKIEYCFLISDEGFRKLVGALPNLKHITINSTNCTFASFNLLINPIAFPNLEEIVFNNNNSNLLVHPDQINFGEILVSIIDARSFYEPKLLDLWNVGDFIKGNPIKEAIIKNGKLFKLNTINLQEAFHPEEKQFKKIFKNMKIRNDLLSINFRVIP